MLWATNHFPGLAFRLFHVGGGAVFTVVDESSTQWDHVSRHGVGVQSAAADVICCSSLHLCPMPGTQKPLLGEGGLAASRWAQPQLTLPRRPPVWNAGEGLARLLHGSRAAERAAPGGAGEAAGPGQRAGAFLAAGRLPPACAGRLPREPGGRGRLPQGPEALAQEAEGGEPGREERPQRPAPFLGWPGARRGHGCRVLGSAWSLRVR